MRSKVSVALLLVTAALAGVLIGRLSFDQAAPPEAPQAVELAAGTALSPARPLPEFRLVREDGTVVGRDDFRGRWTLVFFGFTHCPELCPTTLAMLSGLREALGAEVAAAELPGVALVSADPERDTAPVLKAYLAGFGDGFRGYTGDPEAMREFATALGVPYRKMPMMGDDYMIDHSVAILLINPEAGLAALFQPPHDSTKLQADYLQLVSAAR
ncbi:MAG: SCO family protein [Gammaproteobacteria bacterium]|nr:SCO family protein [Gammaproteobacteria bacterium]